MFAEKSQNVNIIIIVLSDIWTVCLESSHYFLVFFSNKNFTHLMVDFFLQKKELKQLSKLKMRTLRFSFNLLFNADTNIN